MTHTDSEPTPDHPVAAERLHQQIRLITAPTWLITAVLVGVTAGAALWSIFGTVLVQVAGRGILVAADSRQIPVVALERARLTRTLVATGDTVEAGRVLFELAQPELELQLDVAKQRLTALQGVLSTAADSAERILSEQERVMNDQIAAIDKQNAQLQEQVDFFTQRVADLEKLLKSGETTEEVVETARENLDSARLRLVQSQTQRASAASTLLETKANWERQKLDAQLAVEDQKATVGELQQRLDRGARVVAGSDGYVAEILVTEGQDIAAGTRLAVIGTRSPGYEVLVFFDPLDGKRVEVGMAGEIVPSTVKREEYGTMAGVVRHVSPGPVSLDEVAALLGNDSLAAYLTSGEPPVLARVAVSTMPGNPDRFVWQSGIGPPFPVTTGTVADVDVTVQAQAPINLVLPYLKTLVGL